MGAIDGALDGTAVLTIDGARDGTAVLTFDGALDGLRVGDETADELTAESAVAAVLRLDEEKKLGFPLKYPARIS